MKRNILDFFENRKNESIDNMHVIDTSIINYINSEISSGRNFKDLKLSEEYGNKLLMPTMNLFDGNIPLNKKIAPFKGPYLWGRYFYSNSEVVKKVFASMHQNKTMKDMNYNDYKTTIHYHISDLENYLNQKISLRSYQKDWINKPSDYFIGLIENSRVNDSFPYEYLAFFWDRDTNEQYMCVLWNKGEIKYERQKPMIF